VVSAVINSPEGDHDAWGMLLYAGSVGVEVVTGGHVQPLLINCQLQQYVFMGILMVP
jgi:hypothetical protein